MCEKDENISPDKSPMESSRRDFLKKTVQGLCGAIVVLVTEEGMFALADSDASDNPSTSEPMTPGMDMEYDPTRHRYVFLMDVTKCIGCGACVRACSAENDVPENHYRTWVERYMVSRTGDVDVDSPKGAKKGFQPAITGADVTKAFFVPKLCNHCAQTPCVPLCPVGASYKTEDGVILVDEERCIGCGYCVQACPYGSRFIHPGSHVASKCTLCYHRITKGMKTACVQACPMGARKLGDMKDPNDEVSEIIATKAVHTLKPELLTDPQCYTMRA